MPAMPPSPAYPFFPGVPATVEATPGRAKVLVVDDEADLRELLDITLLRMGLDVDSADSLAMMLKLQPAKLHRVLH